jgi:hypothetical protein
LREHVTTIAVGRPGEVWRIGAASLCGGVAIGLIFGVLMILSGSGGLAEAAFAIPFCFFCSLLSGAALMTLWRIFPARLRYVLDETMLVVLRGRRELRRIDLADFDIARTVGQMLWRDMFFFGYIGTFLSRLPRIELVKRRPDLLTDHVVRLPGILLWGKQGASLLDDRLRAALVDAQLQDMYHESSWL